MGVSDTDVKSGLKTKAKTFFKANEDVLNLENCENRPFYKYIDFTNPDGLYLADFSDELTFRLVSEKCRKETASIILKQTQGLQRQYKRSLK